jgi:hypothetical protein
MPALGAAFAGLQRGVEGLESFTRTVCFLHACSRREECEW